MLAHQPHTHYVRVLWTNRHDERQAQEHAGEKNWRCGKIHGLQSETEGSTQYRQKGCSVNAPQLTIRLNRPTFKQNRLLAQVNRAQAAIKAIAFQGSSRRAVDEVRDDRCQADAGTPRA